MFVTQVPSMPFGGILQTFGNHTTHVSSVRRGGDLYIRYPNGTLKNLTKLAGYGVEGLQAANSIAVRDPAIHWDGTKAVFSMVVGAGTQYDHDLNNRWQMYEITGLGINDTPVITKVPNQPSAYNNINPTYGTDDRIIFSSDRPRSGEPHHYPQLDEYERAPIVTGLWSIDKTKPNGDLRLLNHAPSGNFNPFVDTYGRVVAAQWDHLQRDQEAEIAKYMDPTRFQGTFTYASEAADAAEFGLDDFDEVFPEPHSSYEQHLLPNTNIHGINTFTPWTFLEDGSEGELLNHLGRHEFNFFMPKSFTNDSNLVDGNGGFLQNSVKITNFQHITEDPNVPGRYIGVNSQEFVTLGTGQLFAINARLGEGVMQSTTEALTHPDTFEKEPEGNNDIGLFRNPLILLNGTFITSYTSDATITKPDYRLVTMKKSGAYYIPDKFLTNGITKTLTYYDPDNLRSFSDKLWELSPVEVRARPRPAKLTIPLDHIEASVFDEEGVDQTNFRNWLTQNNLALIVVRDATTRDSFDKQQPFNLRVHGTNHQTVTNATPVGKIYDIAALQLFQADQVRADKDQPGRRVLPLHMHDSGFTQNNTQVTGIPSSVAVANDGSIAAILPTRRATTWQLTDAEGEPVVRERFWVTFQPGEIRVCTSCHGVSDKDQAGNPPPTNKPQALRNLLQQWKAAH